MQTWFLFSESKIVTHPCSSGRSTLSVLFIHTSTACFACTVIVCSPYVCASNSMHPLMTKTQTPFCTNSCADAEIRATPLRHAKGLSLNSVSKNAWLVFSKRCNWHGRPTVFIDSYVRMECSGETTLSSMPCKRIIGQVSWLICHSGDR